MKPKSKEAVSKDILFEIGTEELPATNLADIFESQPEPVLPVAKRQPGTVPEKRENPLETKLRQAFESHRICFESCRVWATPRRLVFWVAKAASSQTPKDNLIKLLSKQEAYGADGAPAEKLLMILRHRNVSLEETVVSELAGKEFVFIKKSEPVRKTATVLPEIFESLVKSLPFPKNMKWDDSGIFFPRPIRSLLCLYGETNVSVKIGDLRSSGHTVIFSKGRRKSYACKDIDAYFKILKKQGVTPDPVERKKIILEALEKLAKSCQGKLNEDPFLLNEVNFLVENPQGLAAPFGEEFLKLPLEVLTVSMARKQRLFGLLDKNGRVMPRFLAVLDGAANEKQKKIISTNMENILHAKLQDSLFFYGEDLKTPLEKKRAELKNLIFLKGAGSMLDKSERLEAMARIAGRQAGLNPAEIESLERAARLSKADLLSQMVGEFPELQGVIGKYYAKGGGEKDEVAQAIGEQYLPRTVADRLPAAQVSGFLSILDKIDLVSACFALKMEPTSSLDPYGLRRSATAILKISIERKIALSLTSLIHEALSQLKTTIQNFDFEATEKKLSAFFKERLVSFLVDMGYREDLVNGAVFCRFEDPQELQDRVHKLQCLLEQENFKRACKVIERTANILKGSKEALPDVPDPAVFSAPLEHAVFKKYEEFHMRIEEAKKAGNFELATSLYAVAFFDILNEFFEKVFINAEDLHIRKNRLALLKAINRLYTDEIADLSKIRSL